jgi:uncharacterized membrane protein YecN with MAPEG domain
MKRMKLACTDVIMGNIQNSLATVGPLKLNQSLPLFIHAAGLMDIFERVTHP